MHSVLGDLKFCLTYLDDIIIFSVTWREHLQHLREVLTRLLQHKLFAKASKTTIGAEMIRFLGHIVSKDQIRADPVKVQAMVNFGEPRNARELKSFLGATGFFRKFIKDYAALALPLSRLLKHGLRFHFGDDERASFQLLKQAMVSAPVLVMPDMAKQFVVTADASAFALGAVLTQDHGSGQQPIAFYSRKLKPPEVNYGH